MGSKSSNELIRRERLLVWMSANGENGGYEVSRGAGVPSHRMYPLLAKMEEEGLVNRREATEWHGRVMYSLTEKGELAARKVPAT